MAPGSGLAPDPDPGELKLAARPAKNGGRPWFDGIRSIWRLGKWASYQRNHHALTLHKKLVNADHRFIVNPLITFVTLSWSMRIRNTGRFNVNPLITFVTLSWSMRIRNTGRFIVNPLISFVTLRQCCGSETFWYGTDPDPLINGSRCRSGRPKNMRILGIYTTGTFASFFKDKKSLRSHRTVEIKVFLTIFA
jgi:hypothetical protein